MIKLLRSQWEWLETRRLRVETTRELRCCRDDVAVYEHSDEQSMRTYAPITHHGLQKGQDSRVTNSCEQLARARCMATARSRSCIVAEVGLPCTGRICVTSRRSSRILFANCSVSSPPAAGLPNGVSNRSASMRIRSFGR